MQILRLLIYSIANFASRLFQLILSPEEYECSYFHIIASIGLYYFSVLLSLRSEIYLTAIYLSTC